MTRGRAYRIHQERRAKQRAKRQITNLWTGFDLSNKRIGSTARTRTPCSCSGCGNPRRHFGEITIQERKAELTERDFDE